MQVVDSFRWRLWTTEHGVGKGNDKGGLYRRVGGPEVAVCGPLGQGRMTKLEALGQGMGILPSFFMGMCGFGVISIYFLESIC
jgi:hypothetical protein